MNTELKDISEKVKTKHFTSSAYNKEEVSKYEPEETKRILKNVIVVSLAFMFLFTATGSMANLQSSLNPEVTDSNYLLDCEIT